jgi:hypothetical protein
VSIANEAPCRPPPAARTGNQNKLLEPPAPSPGSVPLPCPLQRNISIDPQGRPPLTFSPAAARTAFALRENVEAFIVKHGVENCGFLTLTFAEHVVDPRIAQQRMNSLTTNVLRPRYLEAIRVYERQKSGRIHYHLLVAIGRDVRTGVNFRAIENQDYRTAGPALRAEWAFWRRTSKLYGFGRTELLPIIDTAAAIGRYVGKYIAKHLGAREQRDLGVRLVSYVGPRVATVKFAWAFGHGRDWRAALGALVSELAAMRQIDSPTFEGMRRRYGKAWAWRWKDSIAERVRELAPRLLFDQSTGEVYAEQCGEFRGSICGALGR